MDSSAFWLAFLDTGAPEMYLLFSRTRKIEERNVLDDKGLGASSYEL